MSLRMKNFFRLLVPLLLVLCPLRAAENPAETAPAAAPAVAPTAKVEKLPGVSLSEGITEITGVAISPLLGVSGVGAWKYFHTPAEARAALPWYCQPWAWGTGLAVLALCFLKDTLGATMPGVLKKPFDMIELFENKASALVASGAFVPLIAQEMAKHVEAEHPQQALNAVAVPLASTSTALVTAIDLGWLMVPLAVLAFLTVWLCSHAINVLIILSPFSSVDSALKLLRTALLSLVSASYFIAPWLGAALCLGIIVVAAFLAPSALRLMIFGTRFAGDVLLPWRAKRRATPERPHAFTLGRIAGLPARTGGRLARTEEGAVVFFYRPWCVLPERTVTLTPGRHEVVKGLLSPAMFRSGGEGEGGGGKEQKLVVFLPRYRGHEEKIAAQLQLAGIRDHALARGFAAMKTWLGELLRKGKRLPAEG